MPESAKNREMYTTDYKRNLLEVTPLYQGLYRYQYVFSPWVGGVKCRGEKVIVNEHMMEQAKEILKEIWEGE